MSINKQISANVYLFLLTILVVCNSGLSSSVKAGGTSNPKYLDDISNISDQDLFRFFYSEVERKPGHDIITVFGLAGRSELFEGYKKTAQGFRDIAANDSIRGVQIVQPGNVIDVDALADSVSLSLTMGYVDKKQADKLFPQLLLRLEEKLIEDADFILFDIRGFRTSAAGQNATYLTKNDIGFVANHQRDEITLSTKLQNPQHAKWIANATKSQDYLTSLEYQYIAQRPNYSSKTILNFAGVPLVKSDVELITTQGFAPSNRNWGTKALSEHVNLKQLFASRALSLVSSRCPV